MLEVINLSFDYADKPLLDSIHFSVNAGVLLHLRGGNGSGKTTLLKLLTGMLQPVLGEIRYEGQLIANNLAYYQQQFCYVGHKPGVSQLLTVEQNCYFDLHYSAATLPVNELIAAFSLTGLEKIPCHMLSVGQRRRAGLLRLLMSAAPLWLLDEPLVALDKEAVLTLMKFLNQHLARGGMVVLSSHQRLPLKQEHYVEYVL